MQFEQFEQLIAVQARAMLPIRGTHGFQEQKIALSTLTKNLFFIYFSNECIFFLGHLRTLSRKTTFTFALFHTTPLITC